MNELAERWARYVSRRSMGVGWSLFIAANGALFIATYFLFDASNLSIFLVGTIMILNGFHLFERAGFLRLLENGKTRGTSERLESEGSHDPSGPGFDTP